MSEPMFDFDHNELRFRFGSLIAIYNRKRSYVLLAGIGADAPGAGDHLRFNVPPSGADDTFDLRPHVTERRENGVTRQPFRARLPLKTVVAFFQKAAVGMQQAWDLATRPVDLDALTEQDLVTVDPDEEAKKDLCRVLFQQRRPGEYGIDVLSPAAYDYVLDFYQKHLTVPALLEPKAGTPGHHPLMRLDDGHEFELVGHLNWFPHGCSESQSTPGWYLTDPATYQRECMLAMLRAGGDELIRVLRKINVALGHGGVLSDDGEALLRALGAQGDAREAELPSSLTAAELGVASHHAEARDEGSHSPNSERPCRRMKDHSGIHDEPVVPDLVIQEPRKRSARKRSARDGHRSTNRPQTRRPRRRNRTEC